MVFVKCRYCAAGLTLHSVARDGVKVVNTSGNGNAVTCITISEGKDITLCKGTSFAKAYNGNDNCVEYANKACAYSGGGVGSGTRGVFINSSGKPQQMNYTIGQSVSSTACLFEGLGVGLEKVNDELHIKFASSISCSAEANLPVTASLVKAYIDSKLSSWS